MTVVKALSPRESLVLHLAVWGYSNREIGDMLAVSAKTVEAHKANGMRKLNISRRSELVRHGVQLGWLRPEAAPSTALARYVSG